MRIKRGNIKSSSRSRTLRSDFCERLPFQRLWDAAFSASLRHSHYDHLWNRRWLLSSRQGRRVRAAETPSKAQNLGQSLGRIAGIKLPLILFARILSARFVLLENARSLGGVRFAPTCVLRGMREGACRLRLNRS